MFYLKWVIAVLIFSILVLVHEFGHFIVAKLSGVEVEEFSMGFGPRIISTVRGGTRYSLKVLLFGGSCRMKSTWEDIEDDDDLSKPREPEPGSFESVGCGRRAAILFAGPFFNFLLAFICAVIVIGVVGYDPPLVTSVTEDSSAQAAGLKEGDVITSFQGSGVVIGRDVDTWFVLHDFTKDTTINIKVRRDGKTISLTYTPDVITRYVLGLNYNLDDAEATVQGVSENSPLSAAGAAVGDVITEINGTEITTARSLYEYFQANPMDGSPVQLTLARDGKMLELTVTPVKNESVSLGFSYNLARVKASAPQVMKYSGYEIVYWIKTVLKSVGALFTGRFTVNDLSGPVGVVDVVGQTYEASRSEGALMTWMNMLNLIILLSANLGVMNLLPIPALDGGRLVFVLIEALRGRPVSKKVETAFESVAAMLLLVLMVYVMYHDIVTFSGR